MTWIWIGVAILVAMMLIEFAYICPDKLPWRRKRK